MKRSKTVFLSFGKAFVVDECNLSFCPISHLVLLQLEKEDAVSQWWTQQIVTPINDLLGGREAKYIWRPHPSEAVSDSQVLVLMFQVLFHKYYASSSLVWDRNDVICGLFSERGTGTGKGSRFSGQSNLPWLLGRWPAVSRLWT